MIKLKISGSLDNLEEKTLMDKAIFDDLEEWERPALAKSTSELIINQNFNLYYKQNLTYNLLNALLYHIFLLTQCKEYHQFQINRGIVEKLFITLKNSNF